MAGDELCALFFSASNFSLTGALTATKTVSRKRGEKNLLVVVRWIRFFKKQHRSYFWHEATEGGICSNFYKHKSKLDSKLARPHTVKHDTVLMLQTKLSQRAKESNRT